jgi:hypothetical protein
MQQNLVGALRRGALVLVALTLCAPASQAAVTKPKPGRPGFRLFASAVNVFTVPRYEGAQRLAPGRHRHRARSRDLA